LSERARSALRGRENDPCMADGKLAKTELLACELARPPLPTTTNEPEDSTGKTQPPPLCHPAGTLGCQASIDLRVGMLAVASTASA
jgi:hypothetical protein